MSGIKETAGDRTAILGLGFTDDEGSCHVVSCGGIESLHGFHRQVPTAMKRIAYPLPRWA